MQGATIVALDPRGHVVGNAKTGPLGFYRTDGLPPGHYSLRSGTHTREITLTRSFVYGQNFGKSATPR
ncbi:MAG: carboxypeptidase-like regulatory domain-containing protein, partial [Rhodanobacteraceae bacterium]